MKDVIHKFNYSLMGRFVHCLCGYHYVLDTNKDEPRKSTNDKDKVTCKKCLSIINNG